MVSQEYAQASLTTRVNARLLSHSTWTEGMRLELLVAGHLKKV